MSKYSTNEKKFMCPDCEIEFTARESKNVGINPAKSLHQCPCCNDSFVMEDTINKDFEIELQQKIEVWGKESLWDEHNENL